MEKYLFINKDELTQSTAIYGNIDSDKIIPFIVRAQELELQAILGSNLYNELVNAGLNDSLTPDQEELIEVIKPMLISFSIAHYLPFAGIVIDNNGAFRTTIDNAFAIEQKDIDRLIANERNTAIHYEKRLINYLCVNQSKFPLYRSSNSDMKPRKETNNYPFVL